MSDFVADLLEQLDEFRRYVDEHEWPKNLWLRTPEMGVYVRKTPRVLDTLERRFTMLDLATVDVHNPALRGKGSFTRFLDAVEARRPWDGIYLENVSDSRLIDYYVRRGYQIRKIGSDDFVSRSLYRIWDTTA